MPKVNLPDGRVVNFPDGMPIEQIQAEVSRLSPHTGKDETNTSNAMLLAGAAGAAGIGAMALKAAHVPGGLGSKALAFAEQLNALKQQFMLSGMAFPKSVVGGVGAVVANSIERRSMSPLRALFSGQTLEDARDAWTAGRSVGPVGAATDLPKYMDAPGRAMGAVDDAIQKSMVRSGMSASDATTAMMQAPLDGKVGKALEGRVMRQVIPFRRTPFNQFLEGGTAINEHPVISAGYGAAGVAQGAAQADDQYPMAAPVTVAASAKYGLPNMFGQLIGRALAKGKGGGGIAGAALPISEYGVTQSVTDPLRPFSKPAAVTLLEKLGLVNRSQ